MGFCSRRAFANASSPQGYQSTGFEACWSRYGLFLWMSRLGLCDAVSVTLIDCGVQLTTATDMTPTHTTQTGGLITGRPSLYTTAEKKSIAVGGAERRPPAARSERRRHCGGA